MRLLESNSSPSISDWSTLGSPGPSDFHPEERSQTMIPAAVPVAKVLENFDGDNLL
jgi:hypothetical protein